MSSSWRIVAAGFLLLFSASKFLVSAYDASSRMQRGRSLNTEYWHNLERSMNVSFPFLRSMEAPWKNPTDYWNTTNIKGVHYIPSYAHSSIDTWVNYNANVIDTELGYAATATINTVRVQLHWVAYAYNPSTFLANLESFLSLANKHNLKVILALFDGTGCCTPDPSWIPSHQFNTSGWLSGPGDAMVNNVSSWKLLEPFVQAVTVTYSNDKRIIGYDVFYQPILELPTQGQYYNFLLHFTLMVLNNVNNQTSFTTFSVIPGGECCDAQRVPTQYINVLSFENYNGNLGAIGGDTIGVQDCANSLASSHNNQVLPVILSGTMSRVDSVPPQTLCDSLFEAYGDPWVDIPSHPKIGVIITNLMIGVDGSSNGPVPNQGLIYPNGTWYDPVAEYQCMTTYPPLPPPPPPGPPPPVVNFTSNNLQVSLRKGTRTIEILGLTNDTTWYQNFSFVPPLWLFLPPQPHRDGPGAHHIGDIILRVQPASETNASSWAFYTSASAGNDYSALPLNSTDPSVYDASDITPTLVLPGQPDNRYTLGLNVTRYYEQAPEYRGTSFRMRFTITNTNSSAIRIGSLSFPLLSNTNFGGLNLTSIAAMGSFLEGYPGLSRSYATIARTDGTDMLLMYSCRGPNQPVTTPMEAFRPVLEDSSDTSGGVMAWEVVSGAFEPEWNANSQFPAYMTFPNDAVHQQTWPNPKSPTPSWHLDETLYKPNPKQYNPPTTILINPGETIEYAICFALTEASSPAALAQAYASRDEATIIAEERARLVHSLTIGTTSSFTGGPRARDTTLARSGASVVIPIPGYVLSTEMTNASLIVLPPYAASVASATVSSEDATVMTVTGIVPAPSTLPGSKYNLTWIQLQGLTRGRARLLVNFTDGTCQAIHYYVLPSLRTLISTYGTHASTVAWLPRDFVDPFGRSASVMAYDREDQIHLLQDGRAFIVGLSDDAGGSPQLGLASRNVHSPTVLQASRMDDYVFFTLMGIKNDTALPPYNSLQDSSNNRIRMTVFYWNNPNLPLSYYTENDKCTLYPSWCSFNQYPGGNVTDWIAEYRAFNFPHQLSVYYSLYHIARDWDGVAGSSNLRNPWDWYLTRAADTLVAMACPDSTTGQLTCIPTVGLMDGTVFREILIALLEEATVPGADPKWQTYANTITMMMYNRTVSGVGNSQPWVDADGPWGSEFSFDTTGQEEVAVWGAYFNASDTIHGELNERTVNAILAYSPSQPNFALHGSAYGMGDGSNNAKWMVTGGWEREGGHYRAGLNAIPVIERFRLHPDDRYLLHVGIGGITSLLPNIDENGAPSMMFHTHPFVMDHDPNSGDWGLAFFGHTMGTGAYLVNYTDIGWTCFLCDTNVSPFSSSSLSSVVTIYPRDSFHTMVFIEPIGLRLVARTGSFTNVTVDFVNHVVTFVLDAPGTPTDAWNQEITNGRIRSSELSLVQPIEATTLPFSNYRILMESSAPLDRPFSFTWSSPSNAQLVRGAYQWPAQSPTEQVTGVIHWT